MSNSKKLTALKIKGLTVPGSYGDGMGLMLLVKPTGARSWILRTTSNRKRRDFGLGGYPAVSLAKAREEAEKFRTAIREGRDPLAFKTRRPERQLFRDAAEAAMKGLAGAKLGAATIATMRKRLTTYAYPTIGRLEVQSIDAEVLTDLLRPIWTTKPETAQRVRQAVIRVLRFARPDGHLLENTLAKAVSDRLPKQPDSKHHAAMPHADLPAFLKRLRAKDTKGSLALQFTILTAARSGETRGALWSEIDLKAGVWDIPAARMKMKRAHRVPLCTAALALLDQAAQHKRAGRDLIFPSDAGTSLSDMQAASRQHGGNGGFGRQIAVKRRGLHIPDQIARSPDRNARSQRNRSQAVYQRLGWHMVGTDRHRLSNNRLGNSTLRAENERHCTCRDRGGQCHPMQYTHEKLPGADA